MGNTIIEQKRECRQLKCVASAPCTAFWPRESLHPLAGSDPSISCAAWGSGLTLKNGFSEENTTVWHVYRSECRTLSMFPFSVLLLKALDLKLPAASCNLCKWAAGRTHSHGFFPRILSFQLISSMVCPCGSCWSPPQCLPILITGNRRGKKNIGGGQKMFTISTFGV